MSDKHVVVGAGAVGRAVAEQLAGRGSEVVLVSRSGTGPEVVGARREAGDAADAERLVDLAEGAVAIYNCINPPSYDVWQEWWPPAARAFLAAAERTGAVLAVTGNLYPYGRVTAPMVEGQSDTATGTKGRLRAQMWADLLAAHEAGRARVVEVRGSDYMGPGIGPNASHVAAVAARALSGRGVRVFGRVDVAHSMTDVRDVARTLVRVVERPEAWGAVWHVPSNPARTQAETVADLCRSVGREPVPVRPWPRAMLPVGGLVVPFLREMRETAHQFEAPWVLDSTRSEQVLDLSPTPWDEVCEATARSTLAATSR